MVDVQRGRRLSPNDQARRRRPGRTSGRATTPSRGPGCDRKSAAAGVRAHDPFVLRPRAARPRSCRPFDARGGRSSPGGKPAAERRGGADVQGLARPTRAAAVPAPQRRSVARPVRRPVVDRALSVRRRGRPGGMCGADSQRCAEGVSHVPYRDRAAPSIERSRQSAVPPTGDQSDGRSDRRNGRRAGRRRPEAGPSGGNPASGGSVRGADHRGGERRDGDRLVQLPGVPRRSESRGQGLSRRARGVDPRRQLRRHAAERRAHDIHRRRRSRHEVDNAWCGAESGFVPVSTVSPGLVVSELELQSKPDTPFTQYTYPLPWKR